VCTPVIPVLGRQRQEDQESKSSLNYIVRPYLEKPRAGDVSWRELLPRRPKALRLILSSENEKKKDSKVRLYGKMRDLKLLFCQKVEKLLEIFRPTSLHRFLR
jgi:hypothetical protein